MNYPNPESRRLNISGVLATLLIAIIGMQCSSDPLQAPLADFSADVTTVPAGTAVTFTDLSTGTIDTWNWSFPGGTPASFSSPGPVVTYNTPGVYDVSLEVSNAAGSTIESKTGYITVNFEADFAADKTVISAGETIFFTDESMGSPISWNWTFPGGEPSTSVAEDVAVTYNTPGSYDVTLEAGDGSNSDTESKVGFITVE